MSTTKQAFANFANIFKKLFCLYEYNVLYCIMDKYKEVKNHMTQMTADEKYKELFRHIPRAISYLL